MPKLNDYLSIKEAAEYLGVSQNTIRSWGREGRIKERRHPIKGYRLFAKEVLDGLLEQAEGPHSKKRIRRICK